MGTAVQRETAAVCDAEQHHCTFAIHTTWALPDNLQGTAANLGMYASGIPMGMITDRKSPRLATLIGMVALFVGYFPIHIGAIRRTEAAILS